MKTAVRFFSALGVVALCATFVWSMPSDTDRDPPPADKTGWDWYFDPDPPSAGDVLTVSLEESPKSGVVNVTLKIDGKVVDSGTIGSAPGTGQVTVPPGSEGKTLEIVLSQPGEASYKFRIVY